MNPRELRAVRALLHAARRVTRTVRDERLVEACELLEQDVLDALVLDGLPPLEAAPVDRAPVGRRQPPPPHERPPRAMRLQQTARLLAVAERLKRASCAECGVPGPPELLQLHRLEPRVIQSGPVVDYYVVCSSCAMVLDG